MSYIKIHQEKVTNASELCSLCPFGAIEADAKGIVSINSGCKMCKMCVRKGGGVFEFIEENAAPAIDKSQWRGITVVGDYELNNLHPVTFELLGKARELAKVTNDKVYCVLIGDGVKKKAQTVLEYGADDVFVYDAPEYANSRIEPLAAALEDFIKNNKPSVILVGGTPLGRAMAPRVAARFRTGLTADCTKLGMQENGDLDQIRPAYGGNIMAHINTPRNRPQFATVRYKIFNIPEKCAPHGVIHECTVPAEKLKTAVEVLNVTMKATERGIEDAEVLVVAGRGVKSPADLDMIRKLASLLHGQIASTRALVECGWMDARCQIGLSGRTVKPKLIITCGVSGAIQFVSGMSGSEKIIAINTDENAPIFKVAHICIKGDLYKIVPSLIEQIEKKNAK